MAASSFSHRVPALSRVVAAVCAAVLAGCGGDTGVAPTGCPPSAGPTQVTITGAVPRSFIAGAGGFSTMRLIGFTVLSAYQRDDRGRPTAELFVFFANAPEPGRTYTLVPVTLAQLRSPAFVPSGPFAVFGEAYDVQRRDYTRWLTGATGCVNVRSKTTSANRSPTFDVTARLTGRWEGAVSGAGDLVAHLEVPVVALATSDAVLTDTLFARVDTIPARTGARPDTIATGVIDAFQTLRQAETRLVVGATVPGDVTTEELWLVLDGVPVTGQTISLGAPSLDEARAGFAAVPFAMIRENAVGAPGSVPSVRRLYRSTGGTVTVDEYVLVGPAALCGWVRGRYSFDVVGTELATGADLGARHVQGSFRTRVTVLSPADSVRDRATTSAADAAGRVTAIPLPPAAAPRCPY